MAIAHDIVPRLSARCAIGKSCDERQFPLRCLPVELKFRVAVCWFTFASFINCFTNFSIMTSVDESHDDDVLFGGTYLTLRAEGNLCYLKSKYYDAIEFFTRVSYRVVSFFSGVRAWLGTILDQFSIIYVWGSVRIEG